MKQGKWKKTLILAACAVLLVVGSVSATLAYLTAKTDPVVNTFKIGSVKLTLDEHPLNADGVTLNKTEAPVTAQEYNLVPDRSYEKDPTVHVEKDSENAWVFILVDNPLGDQETAAAMGEGTFKTIEDQITGVNNWKKLEGATHAEGLALQAGQSVYWQKITKNTAENTDLPVFTNFKVAPTATNETLAALAGKSITVKAYAIQEAEAFPFESAGTEEAARALAAWKASFGAENSQ